MEVRNYIPLVKPSSPIPPSDLVGIRHQCNNMQSGGGKQKSGGMVGSEASCNGACVE